jgi:methionyl aminopeptidase
MSKKPRRGGRVTPPSKPRSPGRTSGAGAPSVADLAVPSLTGGRTPAFDLRGLRRSLNLGRPVHRPGSVRPGTQSPRRAVPPEIARPPYAETASGEPPPAKGRAVQSADVIARMRRAGALAAEVLMVVGDEVAPGVTTDHLDAVGHRAAVERGTYPSPLNYRGYPKSLCTSVNEVICHGIPDDRPLQDGDIVNVDVTVYIDGVHGDTNATFLVGEVDADSRRLVRETHAALAAGIAAVRPGARVRDIGRAIQRHAEGRGLGVVREFIGHGIGEDFHGGLQILHYYDAKADTVLEPGMTFTIEPMITLGSPALHLWDDGWTAVTNDASRCAQFEHTLVVTDGGCEVLTVTGDGRCAGDAVLALL